MNYAGTDRTWCWCRWHWGRNRRGTGIVLPGTRHYQ